MPENGAYFCRIAPALSLQAGNSCIVEFDYGLDIGAVIEVFSQDEDALDSKANAPSFRVVRLAVVDDQHRIDENTVLAAKAKQAFALSIGREKGGIKLLHVRFSYGRDRLFIRYTAQIPVDLRRFIGQLQRDFKTRVDLWQVGVRDETALIGCLGSCGRSACCCSWQRQFVPVNIRMAKAQEMSVNPATVNGSCGRLKCCLRFEFDQYCEAGKNLPANGSVVSCTGAEKFGGMVVGRDVMRNRVTLRTQDGRFLTVDASSITVLKVAQMDETVKESRHENPGGEWTES